MHDVIYQRKEYIIIESHKGYVIINTKKDFNSGHTHIKTYKMAKTIIDCVIRCKIPKTRDIYLLQSCIRISDKPEYKKTLRRVIDAAKHKNGLKYTNKKGMVSV